MTSFSLNHTSRALPPFDLLWEPPLGPPLGPLLLTPPKKKWQPLKIWRVASEMRPLSHSVLGIPLPKKVEIGGYMGVQRGSHKGGPKEASQGGSQGDVPRGILCLLEPFWIPLVGPLNQ